MRMSDVGGYQISRSSSTYKHKMETQKQQTNWKQLNREERGKLIFENGT